MMSELIRKSILENPNNSDEIKKLLLDSFTRIFSYLEANNYKDYINEYDIAKRLQNCKVLVVKQGEDDYIDESKYKGYYNCKDNKVVYLNIYVDSSEVVTHENFHVISYTDKGLLPTFLDEGITQYLTKNADKKDTSGYKDNVRFVEFMHEAFGDVLFEAYLSASPEKLYKLAYVYTNNKDEIDDFHYYLSMMNRYHRFLRGETIYNSVEAKEGYYKGLYYCLDLYFKKFEYDLKNYKYYVNGKLNIDLIIDKMSSVLDKFGVCAHKYKIKAVISKLVNILINNTHFKDENSYSIKIIKENMITLIYNMVVQIEYTKNGHKCIFNRKKYQRIIENYLINVKGLLISDFENRKYKKSDFKSYLNDLLSLVKGCNLTKEEYDQIIEKTSSKEHIELVKSVIFDCSNFISDDINMAIYKQILKDFNCDKNFDLKEYYSLFYESNIRFDNEDVSNIKKITKEYLAKFNHDYEYLENLSTLISNKIVLKHHFGKSSFSYINRLLQELKIKVNNTKNRD